VEPEDCRIAACPAGTVMIRARGNKDPSYADRCVRCPAGTFQIFSTIFSGYNPSTLQPTDADFNDPGRMCAQCPVGTLCPRSTPQQEDFGFTVGVHIIPKKGFWLDSMLLHFHAGRFISANDSSVSSRRAERNESVEPDCQSDFCSRAAAIVSAHRCASSACNHAGNRPEEWSDLLNPENPDWMCGTSGRTGLACGLCKDGAALSAEQICESCGDAEDLWVFQMFTGLVAVLGGGAVGYLVAWRPIFREEHDRFRDHDYRTGLVGTKIKTSTGETGAPGAGGETSNAKAGIEGNESAENPEMTQKEVMCCIMKALELFKKKKDDNPVTKPWADLNGFKNLCGRFITDTIGSKDESDPEDRRRALMGFFKIVLGYFQVTASFFKNFAVDWGERLEHFLSMISILNLDFYKLPKLNCMVMMQNPTRTWQVAFYISLVPLCLFVLFLPRLLCFVAEPWMLTVWERSRSRRKEEDLLIECQNSLTGLNEQDSRKLQAAKDYARRIRERRTAISFHQASWATWCSVVGWAMLLVGGFVVCFNFAVKTSNNTVMQLDSLATTMVGEKCKGQLKRLDARIASQCDPSGGKDKASCLFCGYSKFRKSANDCLLCPCGSELDVINRDCTGVCRKIDRDGNASVRFPLYKALAERKCFPKQGSECVIAEIMGRYYFVQGNGTERWELKYDIGCTITGRTGTRMGSSRTDNLAGIRRFSHPFGDLKEVHSDGALYTQEGCPHFEARQEYKHFDLLKTWNDAEKACVEWGGHLASFHSFADMNATASFMGKTSSMQAWIGLSRDSQNKWTWTDGTQSTYAASNWWGFSSSWTKVVQTWCDQTSKSAQVPPQPRPTLGNDCVYVTLHGNAATCQDKQNPVNELESSALKYSGWTNGACSAAKHFVCSKPLTGCESKRAPTSWPPLHPLQMQGDGGVYWKAMCEIQSGNGFGALSGEGELPISICYSPWTEYAEAFGHTARRTSAPIASDTVSITPKQASVFIMFAYSSALVSLICWLAFISYAKFGMKGIAVLEGITTNILGPIAFGVCVHGALSDAPEPAERLRDRAEWTPGLLVLPAALFLHCSLGFFIPVKGSEEKSEEKSPCRWIYGAGYLGLEVFYLAIASLGTASALGLVLTDAAGLRLLIGLGTLAGLSILLILYEIASALVRRQLGKALMILALFLCACGLGVGTYFGQEKHEVVKSVLSLSLLLALLCYVMIIRSGKDAIEREERLSFHKDLESGSLSGFQVEQAERSKPVTRDDLHKKLTEKLREKRHTAVTRGEREITLWDTLREVPTRGNNMISNWKPLEEDLDAALETAKPKAKSTSVSGVPNPEEWIKEWIKEAGKIYHLLINERKISTIHMTEQVTKTWLFSWTAFLFTFYPALSAVAISGFDCEDFGPEGWRLRDHPGAFCPYKYAFDVVLRYENVEQEVFKNISQIKANTKTSFTTSADKPEHLFVLSVAGVFFFVLGIPVYMYLLLVINGVPKIAHRKRSHAAFQAFARHWRAKKVPGGMDYFASYLIPESSKGKIVIILETSKQELSENKLMSEVKKIVGTLAGSGHDIDVKYSQKTGRLEIRVLDKKQNITDDLMNQNKLSVHQILDQLKQKLPELPDVRVRDQMFVNIVKHLFVRLAKTDADRQRIHRDSIRKRKDAIKEEMDGRSKTKWTEFDEEMFLIRQIYDAPCKEEFLEEGDVDLLGLKRIDMGDEKPTNLTEIVNDNENPASALRTKQEFTREEWINHNDSNLSHNNYSKVDKKCYRPASNQYVTAVDIFEFVRKKQLGDRRNKMRSLVPKKNADVESEMKRQDELAEMKKRQDELKDLKKSFVSLLRDFQHFDTDGGGDHLDIDGGGDDNWLGSKWEEIGQTRPTSGKEIQNIELADALQKRASRVGTHLLLQKEDAKNSGDVLTDGFIRVGGEYFRPVIPSKLEQLRKLLQEERTKQMELDYREFLRMCKDIQMSSTFILPTDELGSLQEDKRNTLYRFVLGERKVHKVWFQVIFRPKSISGKQLQCRESIVKAMLKSKLKRANEVKEQEKESILKSLSRDIERVEEGEGEGGGEGKGDENTVAGTTRGFLERLRHMTQAAVPSPCLSEGEKEETLEFTITFPCTITVKEIKEKFITLEGMDKAINRLKLAANLSCTHVRYKKSELRVREDDDEKTEGASDWHGKLAKNVLTFCSLQKKEEKKTSEISQRCQRQEIMKYISELEKQKKIKVETVAWDKSASEEEKRAINRAGFLFVNYEVQYWWYEIYETLKKLYFICMVTLLQDGTAFKQMAAFLVNFAALVIHFLCRPWVNGKLDTMQAFSILVQTVTIFYSIMLFIMQQSEDTSAGSEGGRMFVETLVIVVNCFVTVFPLLTSNKLSNFATTIIGDGGILRRIPIRIWILLVWGVFLLILALYVTVGLLPNTQVAYFQLGFQSLAFFIGSLLCLNVVYVSFLILYRFMTKARSDTYIIYLWELGYGSLHILLLVVFFFFLGKAAEGNTDARIACVIVSGLAVSFMCLQIFKLDRAPQGWKALQTKEDEAACGHESEEEEEKDLNEVPAGDNLKANEVTAAEESDAHRDDEHDDDIDDPMSDDSRSSLMSDSDDEGKKVEAKVCATCGVKSKAAALRWQEIAQAGAEIHHEELAVALQHSVEFKQEGCTNGACLLVVSPCALSCLDGNVCVTACHSKVALMCDVRRFTETLAT
jgi:hypothetical protein